MRQQCSGCGIEATFGEVFTREAIPFVKDRFYCPRCHARFISRIHFVFLGAFVLAGLVGLVCLAFNRDSQAGQDLAGFLVLCAMEPVAIGIHEFGHAFGARTVGFGVDRIIIGIGRAVMTARIFGFTTEFRTVPVMGVCFGAPRRGDAPRWQHVVFILAGPLANFIVAGLAYFFLVSGDFFEAGFVRLNNAADLFVLINLVMGVGALVPLEFPSPYGRLASDGLLLGRILFGRNVSGYGRVEGKRPSRWGNILRHIGKWIVVSGLALCCAICVSLAVLFGVAGLEFGPIGRILSVLFFLGLGAPLAWIAWRRMWS